MTALRASLAIVALLGGAPKVVGTESCCQAVSVANAQTPLSPVDPREFQQIFHDGVKNVVNENVDGGRLTADGEGVFWERQFLKFNTRNIQFHFDEIVSPPGIDYSLQVWLDPAAKRLATYPAVEFSRQPSFTTELFPPGQLRLRLVSQTPVAGLKFKLTHAIWQERPALLQPQTLVPRWDAMKSLPTGSPALALAEPVAMLHIGPEKVTCSGALLAEDIVGTNYHCIIRSLQFQLTKDTATKSCADISIEFGYLESGASGTSTRCLEVRAADEQLDIALLKLDATKIRIGDRPRRPVVERPTTENAPGRLIFVHHPIGLPMAIEQNCRVRSATEAELLHDCDSTQGSSGSPVFDAEFRLAGIHFKGAYPSSWTIPIIENDIRFNGPRYNRAKPANRVFELVRSLAQ